MVVGGIRCKRVMVGEVGLCSGRREGRGGGVSPGVKGRVQK